MVAKQDEGRRSETSPRAAPKTSGETTRAGGRKRLASRSMPCAVAPTSPGMTGQALVGRLGDLEVLRMIESPAMVGPPVAVVRATAEQAAALRQSAGGALVVEYDAPLRPAAFAPATMSAPAVVFALGEGFDTTIQVLNDGDHPLEQAEVEIVGQHWTAQGLTGSDGKVALSLHGELPETVMELLIRPRADAWGLWKRDPQLQAGESNTVNLRTLAEAKKPGWGAHAMGFDRLPPGYGGAGVKIALIDTGVATSNERLGDLEHGIDAGRGDDRSWSQDSVGHGTLCAGILAARSASEDGLRGYAPDAELHVCKLPLDAACSDLVAALDACIGAGVDVVCVGHGSGRGSAIVEQRMTAAKERGIAIIAPAGNTGGPVQFPACSPHVLAVGAIGRSGTFPEDSPHAAHAAAAERIGGSLFLPAFSCRGPDLDLCAPGVAVISCQAPNGYAASDGTSLAAAHVTALAALVLAHHADFAHQFAGRNVMRVERLFQILKQTAQPLAEAWRTGAGLPAAPAALGLEAQQQPFVTPFNFGLDEMHKAMRLAGLLSPGRFEAPQPSRGPAAITHFPLTLVPPAVMTAGGGAPGRLSDLKAAMQRAGLSPGRWQGQA